MKYKSILAYAVFVLAVPPLLGAQARPAKVHVGAFDGTADLPTAARDIDAHSFSPNVQNVFDNSVVRLQATRSFHPSRKGAVGTILEQIGGVAGFVVADHFVLTNLHLFDTEKSGTDPLLTMRGARIEILYGAAGFRGTVADFDEEYDLLLVRVHDPDAGARNAGPFFTGQPIRWSLKTMPKGPAQLFSFKKRGDHSRFVKHTAFLGHAPSRYNLLSDMDMVVEGKAEPGFSGSPLVDEYGLCYGLLWAVFSAKPWTAFISADKGLAFLAKNGIHPSVVDR